MENGHNIALAFIEKHASEHLSGDDTLLVQRTTDHLVDEFGISASTATDIALQAYAERASKGRNEYIDMSRSTSCGVFLRKPSTGSTLFFTISDLLELAKQREAQNAA